MGKSSDIPALITQNHPRSAVAEAYRTLRTNLSFASVDRKCRLIMVTSASPSEGKSTTSANLAIVLAQAGEEVLLVDGDLRKPNIHHLLKMNNIRGVTNVLIQGRDPLEMAQKGPVPGLSVLTSGPLPPNPAELLASEQMKQLWPQLLEKFDYVIVDAPPVLAVSDPVILASQVDGVILVVWAGVERTDIIKGAKEQLLKAKANLLGVVLNKVKMKEHGYHYYYYGDEDQAKA